MSLKLKKNNPREVAAWSFYDFANSAFATTILAVIFNHYFAETVAGGPRGEPFYMLGIKFRAPGSAVFQYLVVISMILAAAMAPILGAAADYSRRKKTYLGVFWLTGCLFTAMLYFIHAGDIIIGGVCFIMANFAFASGNVFYNGMLLDIAHPDDMGKVSGLGWGLGYLGGGLCLVVNLAMLLKPQWFGFDKLSVNSTFPVVAIWWFIFAIPLFLWVKESRVSAGAGMNFVKAGFSRLKTTFREVRRYKQLGLFLIAYMLFNEGIETTIISASIFGAEVVGLNSTDLIVFFLIVQGTAFIGSIIFGYLVDAVGNKKALLISLGVWSAIVLWARFIGFLGNPVREFYILGIMTGSVMGGSQSAARSLLATFTPADRGAEFFGFFGVCGKVSSIFGPLLYGTAIIFTHSLRSGILVLLVFFIAGGILLSMVDEKKGVIKAEG